MKSRLLVTAVSCLALATPRLVFTAEEKPAFTFDQHFIIPVRVHLLRAKEAPSADSRLTPTDIERVFAKAATIWHQAGIQLVLDSVVEEEADNQEAFKTLGESPSLADHRQLRPAQSRIDRMFHVYYIHRFSVNGVYLARDAIFVQDTARLRPVEGGIDEPLPRVTAHELGHGLGLPHRQDTINLMASGTSGTSLNEQEIELARKTARTFDWVETPESLSQQAAAALMAKKARVAKAFYARLLLVPGESKLKDEAKKRLLEIGE